MPAIRSVRQSTKKAAGTTAEKSQQQINALNLETRLLRSVNLSQLFKYCDGEARLLTGEQQLRVEREYIRLIVLKFLQNDFDAKLLSPPLLVDALWHVHILATQSYHAMCASLGDGSYIHHNLLGGEDGQRKKRLETTKKAYVEIWPGALDSLVWSELNTLVWPKRAETPVASSSSSPSPTPPPQSSPGKSERIRILVRRSWDDVFEFEVKKSTHLSAVIKALSRNTGVEPADLQLYDDEVRLSPSQTVDEAGLEDGNLVDCRIVQVGC